MAKQINVLECFPEGRDGTRGPLLKQRQFMAACLDAKGPDYILYSGGVGSGKTLVGCITILTMAILESGDYLISRLFNPELKLTTYKTFLEICPPELILEHRVADQIIKIRSQDGKVSNIIFRGMEEPDKHRSLNLNAAYLDEASQISEEAFALLQSRLRGRAFRKIIATTNPNGHSWLYRYWIRKDWANPVMKTKFLAITAPSTENVHLPDGYVQNMLDGWSKERVDREVLGSWDAFAGQVYGELSRSVHLIKPFQVPGDWTRFLSADHGYRNPTCVGFWAVDYDGNMYLRKSFYKSDWIIEEICKGRRDTGEPGIISMNAGEKHDGLWIDPSTKADRGKDSDWTTYLDHLPKDWSLFPANNEVMVGIDQVKQYLKADERTGKPRLYIFDVPENKEVIEELFQYRWEELTPGQELAKNNKEAPVKRDDHGPDMLRYAVMSRPSNPKVADLRAKRRNQSTLSGSVQRELHELKQKGKSYDVFKDYEYEKDTSLDPY